MSDYQIRLFSFLSEYMEFNNIYIVTDERLQGAAEFLIIIGVFSSALEMKKQAIKDYHIIIHDKYFDS